MKRTVRQLCMGLTSLAVIACSDGLEPSGGKEAEANKDSANGGVQEANGSADAVQLTAFSQTLYPLLTQHCGQCHASIASPNFAQTDAAASLKVITGAQLVTLDTPASSRLVKRLTEQAHNCWGDCIKNGGEFSDAITAWVAKAGTAGATAEEFVKTTAKPITDVGEVFLTGGINKSWVLAAAYSDGYGDLFEPLDDVKASQRKVMYRRADYDPAAGVQGGAHYYLTLPNSDTEKYQLCFKVKTNITLPNVATPVNYGSRVFVTLNGNGTIGGRDLNGGGVSPDQNGQNQIGNSYVWMPAFYAPDPANTANFIPTAFNLKPMKGSNKLDLYVRDTEPAIDMIALTGTSATCTGSAVPNTGRVYGYEFDLSEILGQPAKFSLQYQKTPDGKAQVFNRPTIETTDPNLKVHVEQIYVVVNDQLNKQLSTFASVNTDVTGGGGMLSTADLIVPFGAPDDKISVYFGKLAIAP